MENKKSKAPFRLLGHQLKALRERAKESLAEVSGAVEVDLSQLAGFELGKSAPSEEVLLLLISHFGAHDDLAVQLWELAGYGVATMVSAQMTSGMVMDARIVPDEPILFTDIVDVMVNNYGVVMNFMQSCNPNAKPNSVARVGMSREHAKSILQILQATLTQTEHIIPKLPDKNRRTITSDNPSTDESRI